jgi:hypothetical protein
MAFLFQDDISIVGNDISIDKTTNVSLAGEEILDLLDEDVAAHV